MSGLPMAVPHAVSVQPTPTEPELAAILAAYGALWPSTVAPTPSADAGTSTRWRFSGRWWADGYGQRGGLTGWR